MTRISPFRAAVAVLCLALALAACTAAPGDAAAPGSAGPASTAPADAAPAAADVASSAVAPSTGTLGSYTVGETTVTLVDALVLPGEPGKLAILYTPTPLSDDERSAVLAKPEWPGMALAQKTGGAYPDRYPYVVATFRYEGSAPTLADTRDFHLLAYGIHEANYSDNVNGPVNQLGYALERLEVKGERVSLAFKGSAKFGDVERRWSIDTPY